MWISCWWKFCSNFQTLLASILHFYCTGATPAKWQIFLLNVFHTFLTFSIFLKILISHDLRQKSINISALPKWILDRVPVLETSLDSSWIFKIQNHDWMWKLLSKKPPKSRGGENFMNLIHKSLAKINISRICIYLDKLWLDQRGTIESFIRIFQTCRIFNEICRFSVSFYMKVCLFFANSGSWRISTRPMICEERNFDYNFFLKGKS